MKPLQRLVAQCVTKTSASTEAIAQILQRSTAAHVKLDLRATCARSTLTSVLEISARMKPFASMALISTLVTAHLDSQDNCKCNFLKCYCNNYLSYNLHDNILIIYNQYNVDLICNFVF